MYYIFRYAETDIGQNAACTVAMRFANEEAKMGGFQDNKPKTRNGFNAQNDSSLLTNIYFIKIEHDEKNSI